MFRRFLTLEAALALSVLALITQLIWSGLEAWLNRPLPGRQVAVQDGHLRYLLYLPEDYRSKTPWPLLVFLHGSGERGYDLETVRTWGPAGLIHGGESLPFIVATPQCPTQSNWTPHLVSEVVDHISDQHHVGRCYLTGYSMGGFGTWRAAAEYPEQFTAIAPLSGGGDVEWTERLVDVPIWAFHGEQDEVVPLESQ